MTLCNPDGGPLPHDRLWHYLNLADAGGLCLESDLQELRPWEE